ncbi:MAG: hypothetical protein UR66_C0002G0112 [Candidatus Moranbacteria bacterium GW2011_GWE1_35_17]|nr:MAG: hypothetical protein UR65_C0057G0001 [Candidatus Moranbacteria bacterium GW2011_GWE2_35_164]KKP69055.1 MAG: hypothetical protein UR66_C0002G0112 [Candidatus Moranbacteria bacterium GW2011_GWE1_35_17]KKP82587.1 MAG: hypothetical protein UR82_C0036G0009 [Candidatus Moranbacteria bacterium GW2011_GWF1_35_5]KKP84806.1 MAG: hypothetical protein UR83_C0011G0006 [Candidatus Moranbacteria bacterium GW2011_GWF2_35_54]
MAKRKTRPGALILRNLITEENYEGVRPAGCTNPECKKKIKTGENCVTIRYKNGRLICRFCSRDCQQTHEHNMLEENGFYED